MSDRRSTLIVFAFLVTLGTHSASAQQAPPSLPPSPAPTPVIIQPPPPHPHESSGRMRFDAARMMNEQADLFVRYRQTVSFAECAQRVSPSRLATLLEQPLASPGERRAANTLIRFAPGCLGHSVLVSTRLLRGAAAEAALGNLRAADPDRAKEVNSARLEDFFDATPAVEREKDKSVVALTRLTQCQVLFAPGLARKVLDAKPDSKDEARLLAELGEGTKMCGQVKAESDLTVLIHRSYLAEALYHWTRSGGHASAT